MPRKKKTNSRGKIPLKSAVDEDTAVGVIDGDGLLDDIDLHEAQEDKELRSNLRLTRSRRSKQLETDVLRISDTDTEDELPEVDARKKRKKKAAKPSKVRLSSQRCWSLDS